MEALKQQRIKVAVAELLVAIGDDPNREGLLNTPDRVARMYDCLLYTSDAADE